MIRQDTLYFHIYRDIILQIYGGRYKKGDWLPSLPEICNIYGIGRNTARSALLLLEDAGYIRMEPRKQAVVTFDMDDPKCRANYWAELAARRQAIKQVYSFIAECMPDIFSYILKRLSRSLRVEVAELLGYFAENMNIQTEQELSVGVLRIYKLVIAMSNNDLLEQLFLSLYSYILVLVPDSHWETIKYKAVMPVFQVFFRKFQKLMERQDYEGLDRQISLMCEMQKKKTDKYITRVSKKIKVFEDENYFWNVKQPKGMEYANLALVIINKIRMGIYQSGDFLPSYAMLSKEQEVSDKTARTAIDLLNRLKIVITLNGVGTQVKGIGRESLEVFLKDPKFEIYLKSYIEVHQILDMLCIPIFNKFAGELSDDKYLEIEKQAMNKDYLYALEAFFQQAKPSPYFEIYSQIRSLFIWGYVMEPGINREDKKIYYSLVKESRGKRQEMLCRQVYEGCVSHSRCITKLLTEYRIHIHVIN